MIDFQVTKMYLNIVHSVYWAKLLLSIDLALFIVTFFLAVCVCVCVCVCYRLFCRMRVLGSSSLLE